MSRRLLCLLLALSLLVLTACGKGASEPAMAGEGVFGAGEESPAASEVPGVVITERGDGSFVMPYNASYGWDPYACTCMENRAVMDLIYEGLFSLNNQFEAEPLLCQRYAVSDDGETYTLELREASFSNGKAVNAEDVIYSMEKAQLSPLYSGRFDDVETYYAAGLTTVIVQLSRANDRFPCLLDFPIVPGFAGTDAPAGTGPFVRSGESLSRNTLWWQGPDRLQFQTVNLYPSVSAEDTRDNFEIDNVHFVYNNPSATTAADFHCDYELWNSRNTVMQYIGFNFNYGLFQDLDVRAAVTHAIDRVGIAESVYHNFADAAVLPAPPSSSLYSEELAQRFSYTSIRAARSELMETATFYLPAGYDPVAAREQAVPSPSPASEPAEDAGDREDWDDLDDLDDLDGLDDPDGEEDDEAQRAAQAAVVDEKTGAVSYNRIIMLVMSGNLRRVAAAQQVAQALTDVGFTVTLQELAADEFVYTLNNGEWDLYYGEVTLQPDFDLRPLLATGGSLAYGHYGGSERLESLLDKAAENSGNYYDLYQYVLETGFLCPVLFINNAVFTARGVFSGLNPTPDNLFHDVTNIQIDRN